MYDITNKESFATLKTWVDELKEHGPKKLSIIVQYFKYKY